MIEKPGHSHGKGPMEENRYHRDGHLAFASRVPSLSVTFFPRRCMMRRGGGHGRRVRPMTILDSDAKEGERVGLARVRPN